ncbi:MAG: hypothetical protein IPK04_22980 [Bdellovibrionales bacterium]|nr:hypothetical protein [Bdellovibrionales bacterium]
MKVQVRRFPLITLCVFLNAAGCSVYKSEGRKTFESKAPQKIQALLGTQSTLNHKPLPQNCEILSQFELEVRANYLPVSPEVLSTKNGVELWKSVTPNGVVQITLIESLNTNFALNSSGSREVSYSLCHFEFKSELEWQNAEPNFDLDY